MRAGYVSVIGKPNAGKSTLVNFLVGQKVSIVSNKPQTTRRRVLGIANRPGLQICLLDTPGIHEPHTKLGKAMVDQARSALSDIDLILYVADVSKAPDEADKRIAGQMLTTGHPPVMLCLNKMDRLPAENVTYHVEAYTKLFKTEEYMLTIATRGINANKLVDMIAAHLPEQEALFPEDDYTDQTTRFMVGELVRERILVATRQEIPHATAVHVESWQEEESGLLRISATILVERDSQRAIILGHKGDFIKRIGSEARLEIENLVEHRVFLELHVKVKEGWRQNPSILHELEYEAD